MILASMGDFTSKFKVKLGHIRQRFMDLRSQAAYARVLSQSVFIHFKVEVKGDNNASETLQDNGFLALPPNYSPDGNPVRLMIWCHGTGQYISENYSIPEQYGIQNFILSQGIAIMAVNGVPNGTADKMDRHYGSPLALKCYVAGYEYVMRHYNLLPEVYVNGLSMGGGMALMIAEMTDMPVLAIGLFCPAVSLFRGVLGHPWNGAAQREVMASPGRFGFRGKKPVFSSTRPIPLQELGYYIHNKGQLMPYDAFVRNVLSLDEDKYFNVEIPSCADQETEEEKAIFAEAVKIIKVPLKIWHCADDVLVPYKYAKYFAEMCSRGGAQVEFRTFPDGGHSAYAYGAWINGVQSVINRKVSVRESVYELWSFFKEQE